MNEYYFFDESSHFSRFGGVQRTKKTYKDYNQALHHSKLILSLENSNENHRNEIEDCFTFSISTNSSPQTVLPEILTKELDSILQTYVQQSSDRSQSPQTDVEVIEDDRDLSETSLPKVSLPASLILQLHSTWSDLIKNTDYHYKVFH